MRVSYNPAASIFDNMTMPLLKWLVPKLNQQVKQHAVPHLVAGTGIPKIIHQIYVNAHAPEATLPEEVQQNQQRLREMNPGWDYRFYRDHDITDFIRKHYSEDILASYNRINPLYGAARADLFRYLVMYQCGGVYLDVKSSLNCSCDSFLRDDDTFLIAQWENGKNEAFPGWGYHYDLRSVQGGEFQQWHIVAAAGHPFLRAVVQTVLKNIDLYIPALHAVGKRGVVRLTGPVAYTLAIAPLLASCPHRVITRQQPFPLRYSIYPYDAHIGLHATHYSTRTQSVVDIGWPKRLYSTFLQGLNQIDDRIRPKPR